MSSEGDPNEIRLRYNLDDRDAVYEPFPTSPKVIDTLGRSEVNHLVHYTWHERVRIRRLDIIDTGLGTQSPQTSEPFSAETTVKSANLRDILHNGPDVAS